jgi:hypothetical protein
MELLSCPHCGTKLVVVCKRPYREGRAEKCDRAEEEGGYVKFSIPAAVELDRRIADWVKRLGIVRSENGMDDFWLRQLAVERLQAWYEGQSQMRMPGFFTPRRRSGESLQDFGKRQRTWQSVEDPRAKRVFKHHFEWFLKYRLEGISLETVGSVVPLGTRAGVLYGVQGVADLIDVL